MSFTFRSPRAKACLATVIACGALGSVAGSMAQAAKPELTYVTGSQGFTGGHSVVEGDRLYVGAYGLGMRIFDISNPGDPAYIGRIVPGGPRADAVPDAIDFGGRRFAVLNGTNRAGGGTPLATRRSEFFDVTKVTKTDPPKLLANFMGPADGEAHNGDIVDKRRLWLPSGGSDANGLRIYDLTRTLTTPAADCKPNLISGDTSKALRSSDDNACAPKKLYGSVVPTTEDPVGEGNPVLLWEASPYRKGRKVGAPFTHTHDIEVYTDVPVKGFSTPRDIALLAEGGSYTNDRGDTGSTFVIDITNPENPVVLLRWLHERGSEHHPIRYHHEAQLLDGDPSVMLITDEDLHNGCGDAGGIVAVRLSPDFTKATELSEWFVPEGTLAPVCSVHVMSSHENYLFTGSYNAGLQVVDYSDPEKPVQAASHIADGSTAWGALYHKGYVYVGDMTRGLDVYRWTRRDAQERAPRAARNPERGLLPATSLGRMPVHFHHAHSH